jgi:hypothetical protein
MKPKTNSKGRIGRNSSIYLMIQKSNLFMSLINLAGKFGSGKKIAPKVCKEKYLNRILGFIDIDSQK